MVADGQNIDFLRDTWVGDRPLLNFLNPSITDANQPRISVREMQLDLRHPLWQSLTIPADDLRIGLTSDPDLCVWTGSSSGQFSSSSAFRLIS